MLGVLKFPALNGKFYVVMGGPYHDRPKWATGVCMAAELGHLPADIVVATKDFSTPEVRVLIEGLSKVVTAMGKGKPIYVGCMGGMGRTGLFMAALAKAWGIRDPVKYVRRNYYPHAVETADQFLFVSTLKFPFSLRIKVIAAKMLGYFWCGGLVMNVG